MAPGLRNKKGISAPPYSNGPYTMSEDISWNGRFTESPGRFVLEERFNRLPQLNGSVAVGTNLDFEVLGTNASNDDVTFASTIGGIQLETDGGANDQVIVLPHLTSNQSAWTGVKWGTENQTIFEAVIRTPATITSYLVWVGLKLTNTSTIATDADQVMFRFSTADSNTTWRCVYSIANTDTNADSGVTFAASTNYHLRIEIDADRYAKFYINDVMVGKTTGALTNDIDLIPYVGVQGLTTAARDLNVIREKISRIIFE